MLDAPILSTLTVAERIRVEPCSAPSRPTCCARPAPAARLADRAAQVTVFAPTNRAYHRPRSPALYDVLCEPAQTALVQRVAASQIVAGPLPPAATSPTASG